MRLPFQVRGQDVCGHRQVITVGMPDTLPPTAADRRDPSGLAGTPVVEPDRVDIRAGSEQRAKNATFASGGEPSCTGPGGASKYPARAGPGGAACCGLSLSSLNRRSFSALSRASPAGIVAGISVTLTTYARQVAGRAVYMSAERKTRASTARSSLFLEFPGAAGPGLTDQAPGDSAGDGCRSWVLMFAGIAVLCSYAYLQR